MSLSVSIFILIYLLPWIYLPIHLCICLYLPINIFLSVPIFLFINLFICIYLPIHRCICLFVSISLLIYLFICSYLPVHLPIHPYLSPYSSFHLPVAISVFLSSFPENTRPSVTIIYEQVVREAESVFLKIPLHLTSVRWPLESTIGTNMGRKYYQYPSG